MTTTEHPTVPPITAPSMAPATLPITLPATLQVWVCEGCDLISHPYPAPDVVDALAGTHNGLTHGGWPAARVLDLPGICESCTQAPAAVGLLLGLGITPFAVCTGCLHPHQHNDQDDDQGDQAGSDGGAGL